ncbi:MAG: large conductance mechanosensitive channel protein MscL [Myxococcales bacterium]|nr:large conductance mechanosensitive channel protein MscL [Myxococcales bacterium]USN51877.1 MAG: large conductance mechanosensitive channel protein MscL [Myxococcales bacterium]
MSILQEFKEFALKGNVIDLAVGLIIANAFGKIVSSLVQDILMPVLGKVVSDTNIAKYIITLAPAKIEHGKEISPAVILHVGTFFSTIVDFFFIAATVFIVVKAINRARSGLTKSTLN